MKAKRWSEIDALYALGTILVVLGHSHSSDWSTLSGTLLESIIKFIYTFHMPLFFFIAGFLLINSSSLERNGYGTWIKNKAIRLMLPYIVLSVCALLPKYFIEHHGFAGFTVRYILEAIFAPRVGVWGHFWFLPVLLILYVLFGLWKRFITERNRNAMLVGAVSVSIILYFLPFSTYWLGFSDFKEAILFFVLGIIANLMISRNRRSMQSPLRIIWIIVLLPMSVLLVNNFYHSKALMLLVAITMISVCWQIAALIGDNNLTSWISRHNFTIYIYSWPFQSVAMVLCNRLNFSWYMTTICMFITGVSLPIMMVIIYRKMRKLNNRFFDLLLGLK